MRKNNFGAFLDAMIDGRIKNNFESINLYANEIKEQCEKLGVENSKYKNLSTIDGKGKFGEWIAFGNYLTTKLELDQIKRNENAIELAVNYLKMAKAVQYAPLEDTAIGLAKIVVKED